MSTVTTSLPQWMPAEAMRAQDFTPAGPEIDYGMRWGENRDVRVSYAPYADRNDGFLYAHDKGTDRYLLLAAHTTPDSVQAAWRELIGCTSAPDAYLALAALDEQPLPEHHARALLLHCVDREFAAYRAFTATGVDAPVRVETAHAVVVQRSARVAAEQVLVDSARAAAPDTGPVVVRYRIPEDRGWVGRVAGPDLESAAAGMRRIHDLSQRHDVGVQATSVSQAQATVAAARVPQLEFAAAPAPSMSAAPRIDL